MSEFLLSPALLNFLLFDWLRIDRKRDIERETVGAIFNTAERLANDYFLPCYRKADIDEPKLKNGQVRILPEIREALREYADLGLFQLSFAEELGGMGLPLSVSQAVTGILGSANVSASGYAMLTAANARVISSFGTSPQIDNFARPQIEGRWFGTMCLSEPQAGSSLGDIRTRAAYDGDDEMGARYRIAGNKMWISGGDHDAAENIVHLVLAKVAAPDGTLPPGSQSISLFIVPKFLPDGTRNDVEVAGLNHKMGNRGTSNCLLNFGEGAGATGWLLGREGRGLAQMFQMMNEARISVGLGAASLAYRGYRHAVRYAGERMQGRLQHQADSPPVPIIAHPDVRRMLLQQKVYAEGAVALCLHCADLADDGTPESEELLALLTPVAKSWPSEFGLIANDLAIQVHGGYGYTRDFDVEQLWRDNRLNPIHEGTTGIQGIDLLRRKILLSDGRALALLRERIDTTLAQATANPALEDAAKAVAQYWNAVAQVIERLRAAPDAEALDDATMFLRAFGHGVIGWLWIDLALAGGTHEDPRFAIGLAHACRFFTEAELPQARAWLEIVDGHSRLARTASDPVFA